MCCLFNVVVFEASICAMFGGRFRIYIHDGIANIKYKYVRRDFRWLGLVNLSRYVLN